MDYGFIGFGSMANMLIHGLLEYSHVSPSDVCVTRKDKNKLNEVTETYKGVIVYDSCIDIVKNSSVVFLCVKPAEIKDILIEIKPFITDKTHIVSLAGTVSMKSLQFIIHSKISKLIPTITSMTGLGVSLVNHNKKVTEDAKNFLENAITPFGQIRHVTDSDIGFAAELTSCAPGFIGSIFNNFSKAAAMHTNSFDDDEINEMIIHTLYATSKLILEKGMSFEQLVSRVATKGGITQEGVAIFDEALPEVFGSMFLKTLEKRRVTEGSINESFQRVEKV